MLKASKFIFKNTFTKTKSLFSLIPIIIVLLLFTFCSDNEIEKELNYSKIPAKVITNLNTLNIVDEIYPSDKIINIVTPKILFKIPINTTLNGDSLINFPYDMRLIIDEFIYYPENLKIDTSWNTKRELIIIKEFNQVSNPLRIAFKFHWEYYEETWKEIDLTERDTIIHFETHKAINENIIQSVFPDNNSTVSNYSFPKVTFKYDINTPIPFNNSMYNIIPKLDKFELLSFDEKQLEGEVQWLDNKTMKFIPSNLLKDGQEYKIRVSYHIDTIYNETYKSEIVTDTIYTKEFTFHTKMGTESEVVISPSNIEYVYPIDRMFNFYQDETSYGFLKMKYFQDNVTGDKNIANTWEYFSIFKQLDTNDSIQSALDFNYDNKKFVFYIPELNNNKLYSLTFYRTNMTDTIPFYISHFRTSYYDSFEKKLYGLFINREAYNWSYYPGVELATNVYSNNDYPELFDKYELTSETFKTNGLVRFEMTGCNNNWFTEVVDSIYQVIYKTHLRFTHRNATELGIPPVKSFMVIQTDDIVDDIYIHDRDIESGYIVKYPEFDFAFIRMAFDEQVEKDFNNLKNQLESYPYENKIVNYIRNKKYPNMTEGTYYYDILYVLPNDKVTSRRSIIAEWNGNYFSK